VIKRKLLKRKKRGSAGKKKRKTTRKKIGNKCMLQEGEIGGDSEGRLDDLIVCTEGGSTWML